MDYTAEIVADGSSAFLCKNWEQKIEPVIRASWQNNNSNLRIAVVGAHGTGKSTLANELAKKLNVTRIDEVARTIHALGFGLDYEMNMSSEVLMWLGQLYEELVNEQFVADRSLLDVLAYSSLNCINNEHDQYLLTALENITYQLISNYSLIIYVPIEFTLIGDGIRNTDIEYQKQIDSIILMYLNSFDVDYFVVTGSLIDRCLQAIQRIEELVLIDGDGAI